MDTTKLSLGKDTYPSYAVGARVFEDLWSVTATPQRVDTQHQRLLAIPGNPVFVSYKDNQEHVVTASLHEKPSRVRVAQFPVTQRMNSMLFPPGPQKSYYRKKSLSDMQNTGLKFHPTKPASEPRTGPSSEPPGLSTTDTANHSEQWRVKEGDKTITVNRRLGNGNNRDDSDSDDDGGVTLVSSLAAFVQSPGNIKLPVRSIIPKPDAINLQQEPQGRKPEQRRLQQQKSDQRVSKPEERENQKLEAVKKSLLGSRSSMASQMAALLQMPGVLNFVSRRSSAAVLPTDFPTPIYQASLVGQDREREEEEEGEGEGEEKEKAKKGGWEAGRREREGAKEESRERENKQDDEKEEKMEACGRKIESEPNHSGTQAIIGKPHSAPKPSDSQADGYRYLDTAQYRRTPNTSFVYLRSISATPTTTQKEHNPPSPERQVFRHLRDGDIVGNEAPELPKANKGRLIMEKMGYKEGTPLGNGDGGLLEPVRVEIRLGNRGLGSAKQEPGLPTRTSTSQVNSGQTYPTQAAPASIYETKDFQQTSSRNTPQLEQMNVTALQQTVGYSLTTPLGAYQTRMRMMQILTYLDALGLLDIVDYNYILAAGMNRVAEDQQQSRLGFLVEAELVQIVTREYKKAVLRRDQRGREAERRAMGR